MNTPLNQTVVGKDYPIPMERLARMFKALGHPTRLRIIKHLMAIKACVCGELVDIFPFAQSTISQHLKLLKEAGIVCGQIEGPKTYFCVDKQALKDLMTCMELLHRENPS